MLLEKNMGTHLSIDESMLHNDLFTFLSNKEGHGKQGSLIAATKGTTISEVTKHLANARYAKKHKPKKSKNGKTLGRPRKRKNEKFVPAKMENDETKVELLTHVRYPLLKSANDWTDFQRKSMKILFKENKRIQRAYGLVCSLRNIFKTKQSRDKAKEALHVWYKRVGKSRIRELIAVRDTIKSKEEYVLNYFNNRSANAAAESLNSKMKDFRAQVRGVSDLPFFMYRMMKIFG